MYWFVDLSSEDIFSCGLWAIWFYAMATIVDVRAKAVGIGYFVGAVFIWFVKCVSGLF